MVEVIDKSPSEFYTEIQTKKVFLFGAGRTVEHFANVFCRDKEISAIIDNNTELIGRKYALPNDEVKVISLNEFVSFCGDNGVNNIVLLITPVFWGGDIIKQLDSISELDGLQCYLGFLLRNNAQEKKVWTFPEGVDKISKKIHYFWIGDKKIPEQLLRYIETWQRKCPEYEIICWNEKNYDFSKNLYMKQAYENKAWGFVPDYARLDIIYEHGGIYLDTDVELLASLDSLLNSKAFFGFCGNDQINLGSGFGAQKKNSFIRELRDYYSDKEFILSDGKLNKRPCYIYQHPVFIKHGFEIKNEYQERDGVVIYPSEVLSPTGVGGFANYFSDKSLSIHHTELSWIGGKEREALNRTKKILRERK